MPTILAYSCFINGEVTTRPIADEVYPIGVNENVTQAEVQTETQTQHMFIYRNGCLFQLKSFTSRNHLTHRPEGAAHYTLHPGGSSTSDLAMKLFSSALSRNTCLGVVGTLLFSSGILVLLLWNWLFDLIIASMLVLKPNSYILGVWVKAPMPIYLDFYFFNWTNPEEIHDPTKKPRFREIGPYRFREDAEKVNLTWNANKTITYKQLRYWYYDEENSVGRLTDEITTLNAITTSAAYQIRNWSYFLKRGFSLSLAAMAPQVHITKTVGELLFDGYQDTYVDLAMTMPFLADTVPPFDKFGWFYSRNGSNAYDGVFNMATGEDGNIGELQRWNYFSKTPFFEGSCGKVHGSAAELYPPKQNRDRIGFYSPDMCRYAQLDYEGDVVVKNVVGYKYSAQQGMLDNGTLLPENECYCNGECVPSGVLNVSSCRYGTPAFVSLPHFYGADPVYLDMVEGLQPQKSKHEVFITLEPRTGVPLDVAIRLQLNIMTHPVEHITLYEDIPKVFFPMIWFEQRVTLPDNMAWMIVVLQHAPTIFPVIASVLIASGLVGLAYVTYAVIVTMFRNERHSKKMICRDIVPVEYTVDGSHTRRKYGFVELLYS